MGSLKVTAAMYFRINGGSTQLKGVNPDIIIPSPFDKMEFGEEYLSNPLPWSVTNQVPYLSVVENLSGVIPVLKEMSEKRRVADQKFSAYLELLSNIDSIVKLKEVPLKLAKRKALAEAEKKLSSLQHELVSEDGSEEAEEKDSKSASDIVLNEGLRILADLISLQKAPPAIVSRPASLPRKTITEMLDEWFREVL
jgi:carboxyl-terminal processing protease